MINKPYLVIAVLRVAKEAKTWSCSASACSENKFLDKMAHYRSSQKTRSCSVLESAAQRSFLGYTESEYGGAGLSRAAVDAGRMSALDLAAVIDMPQNLKTSTSSQNSIQKI